MPSTIVDTSLLEVEIYMALFGLGLGGCLQTLIMAAQNAVPARGMGVATASATLSPRHSSSQCSPTRPSVTIPPMPPFCRRSGPAESVVPATPVGCCKTRRGGGSYLVICASAARQPGTLTVARRGLRRGSHPAHQHRRRIHLPAILSSLA
ncbi:MAG: hypothetical protein M3Y48_08090 [Actinomycetota bacterium]|nr:hypothetical protein [Actinomycetota bacterium]